MGVAQKEDGGDYTGSTLLKRHGYEFNLIPKTRRSQLLVLGSFFDCLASIESVRKLGNHKNTQLHQRMITDRQ